jgi:hypothetical protein
MLLTSLIKSRKSTHSTKHRAKELKKSNKIKNTIKMATLVIIKKAILDMKDRTGSSLPALKKWFETNEKVRQRIKALPLLVIFL